MGDRQSAIVNKVMGYNIVVLKDDYIINLKNAK